VAVVCVKQLLTHKWLFADSLLKSKLSMSGLWFNNNLEKYESQWEGLSHILWKIKNDPNHQPDVVRYHINRHLLAPNSMR
jgi:hypothetical protein